MTVKQRVVWFIYRRIEDEPRSCDQHFLLVPVVKLAMRLVELATDADGGEFTFDPRKLPQPWQVIMPRFNRLMKWGFMDVKGKFPEYKVKLNLCVLAETVDDLKVKPIP